MTIHLPELATKALRGLLGRIAASRAPHFIVGGAQNPYLRRWYIIPRNRLFNIYLHEFLRPDDDRALHDHPWCSISILLEGCYIEEIPEGLCLRMEGQVIIRRATDRHRIELLKKPQGFFPCWTLFITGPKIRDWGFHCPQGFVPWQDFVSASDSGEIGKGCVQ